MHHHHRLARIARFGAIDPTDGGETCRYSLSGEWRDRGDDGGIRIAAYAIHYELNLFSNFTFFLDHSVDGDQFADPPRPVCRELDRMDAVAAQRARPARRRLLGQRGQLARGQLGRQRRHAALAQALAGVRMVRVTLQARF
jgi:hypothetical protein